MLGAGEGPSGASERKERRRELSDGFKEAYGKKIIKVANDYGFDRDYLFDLLGITHGKRAVDSPEEFGGSEGASSEDGGEKLKDYAPITLERARTGDSFIEDLSDIIPTIESRYPDIAKVAISFAVQWNFMPEDARIRILSGDIPSAWAGMADTLEAAALIKVTRGSGNEAPEDEGEGQSENVPEDGEKLKDYAPITLERARTGDSFIEDLSDIIPTIESRYPDIAKVAISFAVQWNFMPEDARIRILSGDIPSAWAGMADTLEAAALIKVTRNSGSEAPEEEGEDPESVPEDEDNEESGGREDEEDGKDSKRYERAGKFANDEDEAFWFEEIKGKDPMDILNNPVEYSVDVIEKLESEHKADRERLANNLMDDGEFGDWYESMDGSMLDLANMGYKKLYELKQRFEQRKAAMNQPLVAVNVASEREIERRSRQIAEADIEKRLESAKGLRKILTKIWAGNFGKEYEIRKRQGEVLNLLRERNKLLLSKEKGEDINEDRLTELEGLVGKDSWVGNSSDTERFVMAHVENMREMIRNKKGENMRVYGVEYIETDEAELNNDGSPILDKDGNPIKKRVQKAFRMDKDIDGNEIKIPAVGKEAEQAIMIEQLMRGYAFSVGEIERDSSLSADEKKEHQDDALYAFKKEMTARRLEDIKSGGDGSMINNYEIIAIRAAERAKHECCIDNVMNGFRYIDGEMNRDVNTEVHRSAVEKLVDRINGKASFVPEAVAVAAANVVVAVTRLRGNILGRAVDASAGGDKLRSQYTKAAREIAMGGRLEGDKLDAKIQKSIKSFMMREKEGGGREIVTAKLLSSGLDASTDELKEALMAFEVDPSNDELRNNLKVAVAKVGDRMSDARLRLLVGDKEGIDLMRFSSSNLSNIEGERMDLWRSIAEANVAIERAKNNNNISDDELPDIEQIYDQTMERLGGLAKKKM